MQLILIFGIIIAIGAVMFALQNTTNVIAALGMWSFEGSLARVLLATLGLGVLIAGTASVETAAQLDGPSEEASKK